MTTAQVIEVRLIRLLALVLFFAAPPLVALRWCMLVMVSTSTPVFWSTVVPTAVLSATIPGVLAVVGIERLARRGHTWPTVVLAASLALLATLCYGPLLWRADLRTGGGSVGEVIPGFVLAGVEYFGGAVVALAAVALWVRAVHRQPN